MFNQSFHVLTLEPTPELQASAYLPQVFDSKNGKMWVNDRPGLGVVFEPKGLKTSSR